jgi:hypothetical protein
MNYLVIYPGRFHPFHLGHKASYDYLVDKYGAENVYIVTSDKQAPVSSPFSYPDKVEMMTKLGVPASHIVKVKNPYQATEITDNLTPEQRADTALIFAVSAKDAERFNFKPKRDGSPSYIQPLPEYPGQSQSQKRLKPMTKAAYIDITPTVNFRVRGQDANSATVVRQLFIDGNDADRDQIITDLYGAPDSSLRDMFKQRLGTEGCQECAQRPETVGGCLTVGGRAISWFDGSLAKQTLRKMEGNGKPISLHGGSIRGHENQIPETPESDTSCRHQLGQTPQWLVHGEVIQAEEGIPPQLR